MDWSTSQNVKALQTISLGVNCCINVMFVGNSKGCLRKDVEEKIFKQRKVLNDNLLTVELNGKPIQGNKLTRFGSQCCKKHFPLPMQTEQLSVNRKQCYFFSLKLKLEDTSFKKC